MKPNQTAAIITFAATLLAAGSAFAAGPTNAEYYPFQDSTSMKVINNTTAVKSTAKSSDDARTMGARGQSWANDRAREIDMYQKAGG